MSETRASAKRAFLESCRPRRQQESSVEDIARACHSAQRALNPSLRTWDAAPEWQRKTTRDGVRWLLAHPAEAAGALHREWVRQKKADGWTKGAKKDAVAKTHPLLVPYADLPEEERLKDRVMREIVLGMKSAARAAKAETTMAAAIGTGPATALGATPDSARKKRKRKGVWE